MKIVSVVPVKGRELLLDATIGRLSRQVHKVICGGHSDSECEVCEKNKADFYAFKDLAPLGFKWQYCVEKAREYNPDAVLIMGSASMICDNWVKELYSELGDYAMIGRPGIHFYHIGRNKNKLMYWAGYTGGRSTEPVGVGRLISAKFLDTINWQLFDNHIISSLDHSALQHVLNGGGKVKISDNEDIHSIRISTDLWKNKNGYNKMLRTTNHVILDNFDILDHFPEIKGYESILY